MKPNQIIMALSLLGLSCSYALADNSAYDEPTNAEAMLQNALEEMELDIGGGGGGEFDSNASGTVVTPDNFTILYNKPELARDIRVDENSNPWNSNNIYEFSRVLPKMMVKNISFTANTSEQFLRYDKMMTAFSEAGVDASYGINWNQIKGIIDPKIFTNYWTHAAAKKPFRIRVNQQSATPFLNVLSRVSSSSISGGKPIAIYGLAPEYAVALRATVEKNPSLKGKLTIRLADFKKFGDKTGSELFYGGVGITGQRRLITVNPIDRNHFKVQSYGFDGTEIKPVVWTKSEVNDNIIKKVFKSPVLKKD